MWKIGDVLVNSNVRKNFPISFMIIGLISIGLTHFLPSLESSGASADQSTFIVKNETGFINSNRNQTNSSEILSNVYYPIKIGEIILPISISSYGNFISTIFFDNDEKSIIIITDPRNTLSGKLLIDIPRDILDSKANGNDKNFTVMIDDRPVKFLEVTNKSEEEIFSNNMINNLSPIQYPNNTESRILMIEFDSNSKIIKINGTNTSYLDKENISLLSESSLFYIPILTNSNIKHLPLQLTGGILNNTQLITNSQSNNVLILSILSYSNNGKLLIDIPRDILDSKANGNDKNFTVMIDDRPVKFLEVTNKSEEEIFSNNMINNLSPIQYPNNTESRILMIEFDSNSKIIKINGTNTNFSENGPQIDSTINAQTSIESESQQIIVILVIAVTIALSFLGLYLLYRKNKLSFIKKIKS
ncbi:hypothetical protein [Candidatus Nitrosocosmicus franklandus]|uniref:Uncharacterized protein n=1 Tax=Candidatus Nitrosocosmicus franklandianus TaxID=1798806 RepID=A0A484ICK4_9ARCH|nr:hypothetical protein [Candidatus Nitrosocosmicus franklandus]VFJ15056.1 conserved protein of unknown function [Candidatus Nitrosocosmicus franklandus]